MEVLAHAIGKAGERVTKYDEQRVAEVLKALGYERGPQRREKGERVRRYVKSVTPVTEAGDNATAGNCVADESPSPTSLTNTSAYVEENSEGLSATPGVNMWNPGSHGDVGDSGEEEDLATWAARIGAVGRDKALPGTAVAA
jgi:hypothetical protein